MGFNCGIVGLPNVGKSTLFNALTKANIDVANYPFCTIEPNIGIVPVPDPRLNALAKIVNPQKILPTTIEFVDIAGLVAGASKGEGLGNQFLANIRETDAIAQVVRCFEHDDIVHVSGEINPLDDVAIINTELQLADLESVEKAHSKLARKVKTGDKAAKQRITVLEKVQAHLNVGKMVRTLDLSDDDKALLHDLHLLTIKPMFYIANVAEDGFNDNPYLTQLESLAGEEHNFVVPICAQMEAELVELDDAERETFLKELGWTQTGLDSVIRAGYDLLHLITFFTAGEKEVRAWTVECHSTAPQAAGKIHTDFERGFIRAEVVGFEDYITHKGEAGAKDVGKLRLEGKGYIVADGDVMHFRFNV